MFESKNFRIIKYRPDKNYQDQHFKKNLIKFYKKFEELSKNLEQS